MIIGIIVLVLAFILMVATDVPFFGATAIVFVGWFALIIIVKACSGIAGLMGWKQRQAGPNDMAPTPAQVAGTNCTVCGKNIMLATEGVACIKCKKSWHLACIPETGMCPECAEQINCEQSHAATSETALSAASEVAACVGFEGRYTMARGAFLKETAATGLVSLAQARATAESPEQRPNVLYIFTDQQFGEAMSCAANPYVKTPAMDRIAANGVRFTNAYCTYPLCVPSRMSMITGRMPHEMEIFANCHISQKSCAFPSMGKLFHDAGYRTHWVGKWHLTIAEEKNAEHGFEKVIFGGGYGNKDSMKAAEAATFIKRKHDKPFLMVVSFNNPHDCCEWSRGNKLKMGPLPEIPPEDEWPPLPENHAIPTKEPDYLRAFAHEHSRVFQAMRWDKKESRRYLWGYYRLVEMVDEEIGKVLDAVTEAGLEENTVIVFSSDHGDGVSRHGWNQKWSLYDESANVPFIVAKKGATKAGHTEPRLVSTGLDLLPTLCDYAGIKPPADLRGLSVRSLAEGIDSSMWRDYVVTETTFSMWANVGEDKWPKARMVRSKRYKYAVYGAGKRREWLSDMQKDPGEMTNLVDSAGHQDILKMHRKYLAEWCEKTRDSFLEIRSDMDSPTDPSAPYQ
jgi:arylsulfatase A-like enzyme